MGNGVAERTKASVATRTVAGSNIGHGRHFSPGRHLFEERDREQEREERDDRAWQKPTGAQFEILPKPKTHVFTN